MVKFIYIYFTKKNNTELYKNSLLCVERIIIIIVGNLQLRIAINYVYNK
jgi:hypothetical protein